MFISSQSIAAAMFGGFLLPIHALPMEAGQTMPRDAPHAQSLMWSDRWNSTSEDLVTWQDRMIAAGKMYRPNVTAANHVNSVSRVSAGFSWSLSNIACGFIAGTESEYNDNRDYFCNTLLNMNRATFSELYFITQGELGNNNQALTAITSLGLGAAGWLTGDRIGSACGDIFDEINTNCNGNTGGSASVSVSDATGSASGSIENQFYEDDQGATCPANPLESQYCAVRNA